MPEIVEQGSTAGLDLLTEQFNGTAVDFTDVKVSIIDATGDTVVTLDTPTHISTGHYTYDYVVAADAELGAWVARWFGTFDGDELSVDDGFTVVRVGALAPAVAGGQTCQPWATHEDAIGACADYLVDPDELDVWMQVATDVLWNLTGRRWSGICSDTVRPNAQWRRVAGPRMWWAGRGSGPGMWGWCSCHRGRETGCSTVPEIRLPNSPVVPDSVVVRIDGDLMPPESYRVDDGRFLVRLDGDGWPCCQDMRANPETDDHTFQIVYSFDRRPPIGGVRACAMYGCQLFSAANPELGGPCVLPTNVVQVVRQGVTTRFVDPSSLAKDALTGLPFADAWVRSILTGNQRRKATAMVPGLTRSVRRTS